MIFWDRTFLVFKPGRALSFSEDLEESPIVYALAASWAIGPYEHCLSNALDDWGMGG